MLTTAQVWPIFWCGGAVTVGGVGVRSGGFFTEEMATVSGKMTLVWSLVLLGLLAFYYFIKCRVDKSGRGSEET